MTNQHPVENTTSPATNSGRYLPARCEFVIDAELSAVVEAEFPELACHRTPGGGTTMFGLVSDMSHLHGLLNRFSEYETALGRVPPAARLTDLDLSTREPAVARRVWHQVMAMLALS